MLPNRAVRYAPAVRGFILAEDRDCPRIQKMTLEKARPVFANGPTIFGKRWLSRGTCARVLGASKDLAKRGR